MPERRDIEGELALFDRVNERTAANLDGLRASAQRLHARERLARETGAIGPVGDARYRPPEFLAKIMGPAGAAELRSLLEPMRLANDEHVGEQLREVTVLLNGDPDILEVRDRLRAWADRYVTARLARPHPKDRGDCVRTFLRLYEELVPWLEDLAYQGSVDTLHALYLSEVCDYIPWLLYQATWGRELTLTPGDGGFHLDWGRIDVQWRPMCVEYLQLYSWGTDISFRELTAALGGNMPHTDPRRRLRELASDLAEMRPFLVRDYEPEQTIVRVTEGLYASWMWNLGHQAGSIVAAPTEERLREDLARGIVKVIVHFHPDGSIRDFNLPWRRLDELDDGVTTSLRLVEAVHDRLLHLYDRIDFGALLGSDAEATGPTSEVDEDVAVAATCEVLRRRDTDPTPRLGVRTTQLLAMLQRLGCEVRPGKGSEISLYRPGGKIWTLGHHKRNAQVGWAYVRRILKRLAIPVDEWLAIVR